MRIFIPIFIMIFVTGPVYAQELVDTLNTRELSEVVVKAQMQRTSPTSTTYTPTAKQKNAAQNAIDLLRQLAIPQIIVNLVDNTVTTPSDHAVVMYINYIPATQEEIEGIRTADVRRVEFLEGHRAAAVGEDAVDHQWLVARVLESYLAAPY